MLLFKASYFSVLSVRKSHWLQVSHGRLRLTSQANFDSTSGAVEDINSGPTCWFPAVNSHELPLHTNDISRMQRRKRQVSHTNMEGGEGAAMFGSDDRLEKQLRIRIKSLSSVVGKAISKEIKMNMLIGNCRHAVKKWTNGQQNLLQINNTLSFAHNITEKNVIILLIRWIWFDVFEITPVYWNPDYVME